MRAGIVRFVDLILAALLAGNEFGTWVAVHPAPPFRKEKEAYGATFSSVQEKRGASS
jgi:hypothetical protein